MMPSPDTNFHTRPDGPHTFTTTHWTVVLAARTGGSAEADTALEKLCHTYWYPLYAFVRRQGHEAHEAQDLTQEFFARLIEKRYLTAVERSKGKFRSFLLAALEHFLANDWRRAHTQKRGGKVAILSLDDQSAEDAYLQVRAGGLSNTQFFERQWATTLLAQVLARLQQEFVEAGKGTLFEEMKIFLTVEKRAYAELALKLGMTEAALKMAVSRMRQRYRELLRTEIASTVSNPEQVEEELRSLFKALST